MYLPTEPEVKTTPSLTTDATDNSEQPVTEMSSTPLIDYETTIIAHNTTLRMKSSGLKPCSTALDQLVVAILIFYLNIGVWDQPI